MSVESQVSSSAAEGRRTRVILSGAPYQHDNFYVDATSIGLAYVVERSKGSPVVGHVTLKNGERSGLVELAGELL